MPLPSKLSTEVASIKRDITYPLYGGDRIIHPDEVLQRRGDGQYKAYDDLRKDGHCKSVLQKRELAVIAREWEVKPGGTSALDKKAAEMVKYHLESLGDRTPDSELGVGGFDLSCLNFLDAILKGFAVGEVMWGQEGKEIYPTEIKSRNQQRFIFGLSEKGSYDLRLLTSENSDGERISALYPRKFITHSFGAKDGNPYGMGLGQTLWFPVFFKRQDIKFWLTFVDKFASPTALGKYKQGATEQQKRILLSALNAIAHDAGVIVPEGMEVTLLEASRSGSIQCYESLAKYMDSDMSKAVLGETLSTDVGDRGSYAASQTHNEVRKEVTKADADLLSDTLNRTLIRWDVELNYPGAKLPKLWRNFEESEDLNTRANRDKTLFDMGWKLKASAVAEIYGDFYEEQKEGREASDEEFLANSGVAKEPQSEESTADMSELDFGSIIDRVLKWQGLDIGVEFLPGGVRFPGRKNSKKLRSGYGHIRSFVGADGEALDCYVYSGLLKKEPEGSDHIFQISQLSPEDGDFDEHKFMLGYENISTAMSAYLQEMPREFFGGITEVTLADLEQYRRKPVNLSTSQTLPITSNFAEAIASDAADLYTKQLTTRAAPIITSWIEQVKNLVEESESFEEVRDRIFDLYPRMDTTSFAEVMGQAMIASEAAGRWEVINEAGENFTEAIWESDSAEVILSDILDIEVSDLKSIDFEEYFDFRGYVRDRNGRFATTGGSGNGGEKVRLISATRQRRQELYDEMSRQEKRELAGRLLRNLKRYPTPAVITSESAGQAATPTEKKRSTKSSKKRLPTLRTPGNKEHLRVADGKVSIWENEPSLKKFDPTFRYRTNKNHEYSVTAPNGENVVLNRHKAVMVLKGEVVEGVPSLYPRLREAKSQSLFDGLAKTMTYVEDSKNPPPAPEWKPLLHGSIDKSLVANSGYGQMQIHHAQQWARQKFDNISSRVEKKEITLEQARAEMRGILEPDSSLKQGYSIKVQNQEERKLVVLAGGTHDATSPLYLANHPMGIHPDTGKLTKFGIPKKGDSGRDWFNEFRGDFWREYYRRESYIATNEINRRVKKGEITPENAKTMWENAHGKVAKSYDYLKGLREERDSSS